MKLSTLRRHLATRASQQDMAVAVARLAGWTEALADVRTLASEVLTEKVLAAGKDETAWKEFQPTLRAAGDTDVDVLALARGLTAAKAYSAGRLTALCAGNVEVKRAALAVAVCEGLRTPREVMKAAYSELALASATEEATAAHAHYVRAHRALVAKGRAPGRTVETTARTVTETPISETRITNKALSK